MFLRLLANKLHLRRREPSFRDGLASVPGGLVFYRIASRARSNDRSGSARNASGGGPSSGAAGGAVRADPAPLVVIHGGPGFPHNYLLPLRSLSTDRDIVWYDQLGCGRSERPDADWCWSIPRFVAELEALREHLKIPRMHLLGHSWGSIVAFEYAFEFPSRVASMVFASPCLSLPRWVVDAQRLGREISPRSAEIFAGVELLGGSINDPEYERVVAEYYSRFVYRLSPFPTELTESMAGAGSRVYLLMWGPNERYVTGQLRNYDARPVLDVITVPTLFTCGRYDEATPEATAEYAAIVPGSSVIVFEDCAHLPHLNKREKYASEVRGFLAKVDAG